MLSSLRRLVNTKYLTPVRLSSLSQTPQKSENDVKLYILEYHYVKDATEKRQPYREEHLKLASKLAKANKIILAGATEQPPTGGVLIWRNTSVEEITEFVRKDPYVQNGVVTKWTIKPFLAVVGAKEFSNDLLKV
ncbi:unnamed protein product [Didymodactylos carnosus]|uniref:YCII-related domain-containing protein n=1 Tax=Didymodactylos carnosus TaxID=1234261 RepID=A0A813RET9_9BILA|nr:unnamed protein product [Didymodactylos carnosus]CAF3564430.1 unnamed protein product [Didymodactylos carnosus]